MPAGDVDDDDEIDLDRLNCEELLALNFDIISGDVHKDAIDLDELQELLAECIKGGSPSLVSLQGRLVSGGPFTLNLSGGGNFVAVSGIIDPTTGIYTGQGIGTVAGFPDVTVEMVLNIAGDGGITGTYTMGAAGELPGAIAAVYAVTGNFPLTTLTPTPSPTATPMPTATPVPTATAAPGVDVAFGDVDCSGDAGSSPASISSIDLGISPVDALKILRGDAGLTSDTGECPPLGAATNIRANAPSGIGIQGNGLDLPWGDLDCNGAMTPVDALKTLRFDAALSVSQEAECFEVGSLVTVVEL